MIIKNIFTRTFFEDWENPKLCNKIKRNQEPLVDVTEMVASRGDSTITINNWMYSVIDWDTVVMGHTAKLFQTGSGVLVVVNTLPEPDFHLIAPINPIQDTNVISFKFVPFYDYDDSNFKSKVLEAYLTKETTKLRKANEITEKVVGTSFYEKKDLEDFDGEIKEKDNVPVLHGAAILMPEPENQYDPNAIAVIAKMTDGTPHKIGHIGRDSELYNTVTKPTPAALTIYAYSHAGNYNDSFTVTVDKTML